MFFFANGLNFECKYIVKQYIQENNETVNWKFQEYRKVLCVMILLN